MINPASFAPLLERFFTQRLMQQRQASPHTISSYRDSFRQFLKFAQKRLCKPPSRLSLEEVVGAGANVLVFGRFQNADGFASALA